MLAWMAALFGYLNWIPLAGKVPLGLYAYYSFAVALGWICGNVYVWRSRKRTKGRLGGRLLVIYLLGPPSVLFLLRTLAPARVQEAAPLAATWAFGVYVILFLVPVTLKPARRR